jgi:hypothetical protein
MRILLTLNVWLIISTLLNAQQSSQNDCINTNLSDDFYEDKITGEVFSNPVFYKGSQFYNDNWDLGEIRLINGKTVKNKYLKYNSLTDDLYWLRKNDYQQIIVNKDIVKEFTLISDKTNSKMLFRKMKITNWYTKDSASVFLQVLTEGKITLYSFRKIQIINNTNELFPFYKYLISKDDGSPSYFVPLRKNLLKLYPEKKAEIRAILRKEHLRVKKHEEQLIKAIELINQANF